VSDFSFFDARTAIGSGPLNFTACHSKGDCEVGCDGKSSQQNVSPMRPLTAVFHVVFWLVT
jgi:hypothetical protein